MTPRSERPTQVIRSSTGYRLGVGGLVTVVMLLFVVLAVTDDVLFVCFALVGAVALADILRSEVRVDLDRRVVSSRRVIRTWSGPFEDITNVRVPPWGPIVLTLDPNRPARGAGMWQGQVTTGVQAQRSGSLGQACRLADLLGVEVVSVWPQVKSGSGNGQQSLGDLARHGSDSTSIKVVAIVAAVCVLAIVGLAGWGLIAGP